MPPASPSAEEARATRHRNLFRAAAVALAAIVGLTAWLTTGGRDEDGSAPAAASGRAASKADLAEAAARLGHPVYWAGIRPGTVLQLTESPDGSALVRYLPEGAPRSDEVLTVGSYPLPDPAGALDAFAARPGSSVRSGSGGSQVVTSRDSPTSAYFVSPDNSVQVEVYDPSPARAMRLALSGRVRPAG